MKTANVIEGLQILQKYRDQQDGYDLGAEHDVLYAYSTDRPLSEEDVNRMIELGWFQEDSDCPPGELFSAQYYDSEESWSAFV